MRKRLTNRLADMLAKAFDHIAIEGDLDWDVQLGVGPQGPIGVVLCWQKGALLGTVAWGQTVLANPAIATQDDIDTAVRSLLEAVAQERTKQLTTDAPPPSPLGIVR